MSWFLARLKCLILELPEHPWRWELGLLSITCDQDALANATIKNLPSSGVPEHQWIPFPVKQKNPNYFIV